MSLLFLQSIDKNPIVDVDHLVKKGGKKKEKKRETRGY